MGIWTCGAPDLSHWASQALNLLNSSSRSLRAGLPARTVASADRCEDQAMANVWTGPSVPGSRACRRGVMGQT